MEHSPQLDNALNILGEKFMQLDLSLHKMDDGQSDDVTPYWPGGEDENVTVCVLKGHQYLEPFHRHDFFFINYAYQNSYEALSENSQQLITIEENSFYIGQPYSGYALRVDDPDREIIVIGVLIRKDAFFRNYLPIIYTDSALFRFFIEPQKNKFSDAFIHLAAHPQHPMRKILELMVMEYAHLK